MDAHLGTQQDPPFEITFPNGRSAQALVPAPETRPAEMLHALGIEPPRALIMIAGGAGRLDREMAASPELRDRLTQLFGQGVACAAVNAGALIIDGGTESGVMALTGQGVAGCLYQTPLLGVTPVGRATYPGGPEEGSIENGGPLDPHHSHFVLAGEDWGDETNTMYALAGAVVGPANQIPVVTVVAHGGTVVWAEVLHNVRRDWSIIVIAGSGGAADEIVRHKRGQRDRWWHRLRRLFCRRSENERILAEIIKRGRIQILLETDTPEKLEQLIGDHLTAHA